MVDAKRLAGWLHKQFLYNLAIGFRGDVAGSFDPPRIRYLPLAEAVALRERAVAVPTDVPAPLEVRGVWRAPFNGTSLSLWNRLPRPDGTDWSAFPGPDTAICYRHPSGTILPAWNLFANLCDMLTFREERELPGRDEHGRFPLASSPRHGGDILRIPAFNEALAFLVAAIFGRCSGSGEPRIDDLVLPPTIVLSHDCDILDGGDRITQTIRLYNGLKPILRGRPPNLRKLWHIPVNVLAPRRYYFDNALGMVELERQYSFRSVFYILNGSGGRFGARSGSAIARALVRAIPEQWEVGMHYNYDTFRDRLRFLRQKEEIEGFGGRPVCSGRAHYLRFDPLESFGFLHAAGIRFDESIGFADYAGYRCGIAGVFRPLDPATGAEFDVLALPMTFMDRTMAIGNTEGETGAPRGSFDEMVEHIRKVGGTLSILFHPGSFHNTEEPQLMGNYHESLRYCYQIGAASLLPRDVLRIIDGMGSSAGNAPTGQV